MPTERGDAFTRFVEIAYGLFQAVRRFDPGDTKISTELSGVSGGMVAKTREQSVAQDAVAPDEYFAFPIDIRPSDIDDLGHVNNAVYLNWVQAAVLGHWHRFAPDSAIDAYRWVAVRHDIIFRHPAVLGDHPVACVRLQRVKRESAFYMTRIMRGSTLLAEVTSRWCCMDALTFRPTILPNAVVSCFRQELDVTLRR